MKENIKKIHKNENDNLQTSNYNSIWSSRFINDLFLYSLTFINVIFGVVVV